MKTDEQTNKATNEDLMNQALKNYEDASNAIHCWNSSIPKAIRAYFASANSSKERQIIEIINSNLSALRVLATLTKSIGLNEGNKVALEMITENEVFIAALKSEISEPEKLTDTGQQYHLNCEKCGDIFWSVEAFPKPQLCDKCTNLKQPDPLLKESGGKLNKTAGETEYASDCIHSNAFCGWWQDHACNAEGCPAFKSRLPDKNVSQFQEQPANQTVAYNVGLQDYGQEQSAKDYLNECIERATPNLSKIKDVDKELAEIRGEQPITDVMLKEKAQKFLNSRMIVDSEYWDYDKTKFVLSDILVKWALSLKAKPIDLKDELIKFLKWYHPSGAQIEPMIDKYLSQYNPSPKAQKNMNKRKPVYLTKEELGYLQHILDHFTDYMAKDDRPDHGMGILIQYRELSRDSEERTKINILAGRLRRLWRKWQ